ncbi:MAG: hypothetical protein ACOX1P_28910 [Thermoguttaceae bacterium]|jgi:hypothetical protein
MQDLQRSRPGAMIGLAFTGVVLGAFLGALTNSVNGWVSPTYFRNIMRWHDVADIWRASIAQGILEGLMFGLAFSVIFVAVIGIVSRARCPCRTSAAYLVGIAVFAVICWVVGGFIAMGLATLSPEFYRHAFRGVPEDFPEMLRYAWVGGSIWGLQFGGLVSVIVGSVLFQAKWRALTEDAKDSQKAPPGV